MIGNNRDLLPDDVLEKHYGKKMVPYIKKYWVWHKTDESNKVYWADGLGMGTWVFSFEKDPKKRKENCFYFYRDYPNKLTKEQKAVFDKENPTGKILGRG